MLELPQKPKAAVSTRTVLLTILILVSLLTAGILGYSIGYSNIGELQNQVSALQRQMSNLQSMQGANQNAAYTYVLASQRFSRYS